MTYNSKIYNNMATKVPYNTLNSRLNIVITHGSTTNGSTNYSINHVMSEFRSEIEME